MLTPRLCWQYALFTIGTMPLDKTEGVGACRRPTLLTATMLYRLSNIGADVEGAVEPSQLECTLHRRRQGRQGETGRTTAGMLEATDEHSKTRAVDKFDTFQVQDKLATALREETIE
jgi:hypothetical protein